MSTSGISRRKEIKEVGEELRRNDSLMDRTPRGEFVKCLRRDKV